MPEAPCSGLNEAALKKNEPTHIGEILKQLAKNTALGTHLEHARIWERWPELAGMPLAAHTRPKSVAEKVLRVEADSAVWMNYCIHEKARVVRNINRMARKKLITDLFVMLIGDDEKVEES